MGVQSFVASVRFAGFMGFRGLTVTGLEPRILSGCGLVFRVWGLGFRVRAGSGLGPWRTVLKLGLGFRVRV